MIKVFLLLTLFISSLQAQTIDSKVNLYLKWKHQFQFAGYYVAKEMGYYKEAGIDVEIIQRDPSWSTSEKVGTEKGNYGISDSSIILEYLMNKPFIIVASIYQHSPLVLATRKEDNILSPIELKGKKVMYQQNVDDAVFKVMFDNTGISEKDFISVAHSFNNDDLINKKVDAISIYTTNQPFYFNKAGQKIHIIAPVNYGVDLYGDLLFTNENEAKNYPERVEAIKKATIKGWYYALDNVEEVAKLIKNKYQSLHSLEKLIYEGNKIKEYVRGDLIPIGTTNVGRLERIAKVYGEENNPRFKNLDQIIFNEYLIKTEKEAGQSLKIFVIILLVFLLTLLVIFYINLKLKKDVQEKTKELREANKHKSLFFAKMTHELRTPLNAIIGSLYFMQDTNLSDKQKELVDIGANSSEQLLDIVNDILDFSKLEKREIILNNEPVKIYEFIEKISFYHILNAEKKGLLFKLINIEDENLVLSTDPSKLAQILNNILSNAIKFTEKGRVEMICLSVDKQTHTELTITVKDTGKGINEAELKNVFDPFKQENRTISSKYGGTGLGLAICKELVALFEGEINVTNNDTGGCCFIIKLNFKKDILEKTKPNLSNDKIEQNFSEIKVLVVDDHEINLILMKKYLEKLNIEPAFARNGKEGIEKLEEEYFDIVFMDKQMPVMDGIKATKAIRSHQNLRVSNTYIVGQSANWITGHDQECAKVKMNASIAKPMKFEDLVKVIGQYQTRNNQDK